MAAIEAGFEPEISAFVCNGCTHVGADLADSSCIQCLPVVRTVRLMCSGVAEPNVCL